MKKFIKLLPVALGLISLASCSNEDFLSGEQANDLSDKYVLTATEEDGITRAYKDFNQGNTTYQAAEVMRVYDSNMAKFDEFKFDPTNNIFTIGSAAATITEKNAEGNLDYAYALFGTEGEKISYAGWNGNNLALIKIADAQTYAEAVSSMDGTTRVYKENLPQWGIVTSEVSEKTTAKRSFTTSLRYLTGRVKVVFENGANNGTPVTNVRVTSLAFQSGKTATDLATATASLKQKDALTADFVTDYSACVTATGAKPIAGWFEAVLDPAKAADGIRQVTGTDNLDAINEATGNVITETVGSGAMDDFTNVFFFPIVPDTYEVLVFEYSDDGGAHWKFIDYLTGSDATIARGQKVETNDKDDWTAGIDLTVSNDLIVNVDYMQNCEAVTKVMADNTIKEAPVIINLNPTSLTEYVKTINSNVESQYTIYIPQLKNNMTVNFKTQTILNKKLVIKDVAGADNSNYTIKFNFSSIDATSYDDIEISTTAKELKLEGDYSNLTAAKAVKVLAGNVTVTADEAATTIVTMTNEGAGTIAIDGNTTNALGITTLNAGSAAKVKVAGDATKTTITTLNADDCDDVEVGGGTVSALKLSDNAATITVNGNGVVTSIDPDATISTSLLTSDVAITVNSADNGIINAFTNVSATPSKPGLLVYTLSSKFTENTTVNSAAQPASNEIYTAAQLNSIEGWSNPAKLMTAIEIASGTWTSPNIKVPFDGDNKAITKLNAPLFGQIQTGATTIEKLNISDANITATAAKAGVLAKEAVAVSSAAIIAIKNSTIAGTISSEYNFVGGLIGVVDASTQDVTVTFGTDGAAAGATATLSTDITLNNTKTYSTADDILDVNAGTWGEYVGSVVGAGTNAASVTVNFDCASAKVPTATDLKYNWKRSAKFEAGKVVVKGYLTDTNVDGSKTDHHWIGFVGTTTDAIKVLKPTGLTKITLKYPMTVNGDNSLVTFPNATATEYGTDGTKYTFVIDGLDDADVTYASLNDKSGVKVAGTPKTGVIYHNAYTATAY